MEDKINTKLSDVHQEEVFWAPTVWTKHNEVLTLREFYERAWRLVKRAESLETAERQRQTE